MPKIPINFENSIIYKLVCLDTTYPEVYVGSTTNFKQRKSNHKSKCHNEKCKQYNYKIYQYIREHGGWENFAMIEIEKIPCENNRQLEQREEYWRKELHATLNGCRAFRTEEERIIQISEWQKNEGYASHLLSVKKWNDDNKDKRKVSVKAYYEANKEKINLYKKEYRLRKKLEKLNNEIPETNIIEN
jgi:predicted GIY-YIG superfamily endonuclease